MESSLVSRRNAEHFFWEAGCHAWHLLKSRRRLSLIEECRPPGATESRHSGLARMQKNWNFRRSDPRDHPCPDDSLLYGVRAFDPQVLLSVPAVFTVAAFMAQRRRALR